MNTLDALIIGSGILGLATAIQMGEHGYSAWVLDEGNGPGGPTYPLWTGRYWPGHTLPSRLRLGFFSRAML